MSDFLNRFAAELWQMLLDSGVWLVVGFALAGVVHVLVPRSVLARHLSGGGLGPIVKASLLGIPLPLCSCSVIPVAAGLRASGASKGSSAAFAISTPQTGEESIPLTWALFGPVYAFTRPVVAVVTAFIAGVLIDRLVGEGAGKAATPEPEAAPPVGSCGGAEAPERAGSCCSAETEPKTAPCCAHEPVKPCCGSDAPARSGFGERTGEVFRYGFVTMMRDLAPWLAVGFALSALVAAAVPEGWIESNIGTGLAPMLLMLVVGLPLYVCATSTTPLAYALVVAGLSPGAALVLLLAGPATNAATMSWVVKDLGVRALVIYLGVIGACAVAAGWAFDATLRGTIRLAEHGGAHQHMAISVVQTGGALVFAALLLWALVARYTKRG